jgi:hypothetical protein
MSEGSKLGQNKPPTARFSVMRWRLRNMLAR